LTVLVSVPAKGLEGFPDVAVEKVNFGKDISGVGNSLGFEGLGYQTVSVVDAFRFFLQRGDLAFAGFPG
jgi:hypothetical protein